MRSWCSSFTAGLALLFVFLPSPARVAMTDLDLSSRVQDIMAENFAPVATANDAGGLASAVYVAGHVQFFNYGLADQAGKRPITPDTLFNIASVRKVFEAALVALGTLRGEIRLDDPVNRYVTELNGDYIRRVTIGELATHTSGLLLATDHPPWPNESYSLGQSLTSSTPGRHRRANSRASNASTLMPVTCCCS